MTLIHIRTATKTVIKIIKQYEREAYQAYESVSGKKLKRNEDGSFQSQGKDNDVDAFIHAYVSAAVAQDYTVFISKIVGWGNEILTRQLKILHVMRHKRSCDV